jgi:hypothetical protein
VGSCVVRALTTLTVEPLVDDKDDGKSVLANACTVGLCSGNAVEDDEEPDRRRTPPPGTVNWRCDAPLTLGDPKLLLISGL